VASNRTLTDTITRTTVNAPGDIVGERRRWAYRFIGMAAVPPPTYGSAEWLASPDSDPVKIAAVVIAAEATAREADDLEVNLRRELDAARRAHKASEDAEYAERAAAWRDTSPRWGPSFVERRQAQLDAAKPRLGDFTGRGT